MSRDLALDDGTHAVSATLARSREAAGPDGGAPARAPALAERWLLARSLPGSAGSAPISEVGRSLHRNTTFGAAAALLLVGVVFTLMHTTTIAGAVIASGALVVETNTKKVQHLLGGVVADIRVREGDRVKAGQLLMRLDDTVARSSLAIITKALDQYTMRAARLTAELSSAPAVPIPAELKSRMDDPETRDGVESELKLFEARRTGRDGERKQLRERIAQSRVESEGLRTQAAAKAQEIVLIQRELVGVRELFARKLTPLQRVTQLERDATRIEGERGALLAQVAAAQGKIAETELQILQVDEKLRSEAASDLREAQGKIAENVERRVTALDTLNRIEVRAPQDGFVNQLLVYSPGGTVAPNEVIALIVPERDTLVAEVKARAQDIEQIYPGQKASLQFTALDRNTAPKIDGKVTFVGGDVLNDKQTGQPYFVIRVIYGEDQIRRLGDGVRLQAGMPVEAFLSTGDRSFMSYLLKPLTDQMNRAFRWR